MCPATAKIFHAKIIDCDRNKADDFLLSPFYILITVVFTLNLIFILYFWNWNFIIVCASIFGYTKWPKRNMNEMIILNMCQNISNIWKIMIYHSDQPLKFNNCSIFLVWHNVFFAALKLFIHLLLQWSNNKINNWTFNWQTQQLPLTMPSIWSIGSVEFRHGSTTWKRKRCVNGFDAYRNAAIFV